MRKITFILCLALSLVLLTSISASAKNNKIVDKGVFVDYGKAKVKGGAGAATDQSTTYKYRGVHWANPNVSYRVNQASSGLDPAAALAAVQAGFNTWETELNPFGLPDLSVIDYTYDPTAVSFSGGPKLDGENSVSWGTTPSNAIAVTYYWYYRGSKELVEFDMVFSNALPWSTTGAATAYDVYNITAHEAGHTLVLLDLYNSRDSELTMFGYGALGEIKKQTLGRGDMLGVEKIYPSP